MKDGKSMKPVAARFRLSCNAGPSVMLAEVAAVFQRPRCVEKNNMNETLELLETRRSSLLRDLGGDGPDAAQLQRLLTIGARVPDHGKLAPWRFIVIEGAARARFGEVLEKAAIAAQKNGGISRDRANVNRFSRVPVIITVVSKEIDHIKIPHWEQILSSGAVCQNLLIGAAALGFGGQWITDWPAYDQNVLEALGLTEGERVAGFVCLGMADQTLEDRPRPDLSEIVTRWQG